MENKKDQQQAIKKRIPIVSFTMDYLRSPEDALIKWNQVENGRYKKWAMDHFAYLVRETAKATGADPEQIADKKRRTPEQQKVLLEIAAKEQMERFDKFFQSAYMEATLLLQPIRGTYKDTAEAITDSAQIDPDSEFISLKEQVVLYFFAKHDELKPDGDIPLTEDQKEELKEIYKKLDSFYYDRTGGKDYPNTLEILYAFIEQENPAADAAEAIAAKLPLLQAINPTAHTMPNNALMNTLQTQKAINAGAFDMVVSNAKGRRKEITAYTMISFDPGETSIKITDAQLSEYERQVSDAIISLWIEALEGGAAPRFSPDMIYRSMPGGGIKASDNQKADIDAAIEKFRHLHIYVDATEEMRKRGIIDENKTYIFDEFYLNVRRHTLKTKNGGTILQGYEILSQPIILTYCYLTKQLLTVSAKLLSIEKVHEFNGRKITTGELIPMNTTRQSMTGYLLRRIEVMKHDERAAKEKKRAYDRRRAKDKSLEEKQYTSFKEQSQTILFETIFSDVGLTKQSREETRRNRNFIFQVLEYWILCGSIKGYEKQTKGRSITGVKILL